MRLARHPGHQQPPPVAEATRAPDPPLGMNICPALITALAYADLADLYGRFFGPSAVGATGTARANGDAHAMFLMGDRFVA